MCVLDGHDTTQEAEFQPVCVHNTISGTMTVLEWLTGCNLANVHDAMVDMGLDNLRFRFLLEMDDEEIGTRS